MLDLHGFVGDGGSACEGLAGRVRIAAATRARYPG